MSSEWYLYLPLIPAAVLLWTAWEFNLVCDRGIKLLQALADDCERMSAALYSVHNVHTRENL